MKAVAGLAIFTAFLGAAATLAGCGSSSPASPSTSRLPPLADMLVDKVLGSAGAPVTMIEYSSLNCSHCADFHRVTLPQLRANYIDPGRVKLVYREFPLSDAATSASMVARCSGDKFFTTLDVLFQGQASWASSADVAGALKSLVAPLGMTSADVDGCLASQELRAGILDMKQVGTRDFGVSGTPTFIINGQTVVGAQPYATFDTLLKSLLGG